MSNANAMTLSLHGDRELLITRRFRAPRQRVFDAHTKPELVRRWLLGPDGWTMPVCEIDLRVGGKFRYVWQNQEGRQMGMGGTFLEIEAPSRIVHNELFDEDWTGGEAHVIQTFTETDGVTLMSMIVRYSSPAARDSVLKTPMEQGMAVGYDRLEALLSGKS